MGHLDNRVDRDKDATDQGKSGRVKGGVSGNAPESKAYETNKIEDSPHGPASDVVRKKGEPDAKPKP